MATLRYIDLGRASYPAALDLQRRLVEEVSAAADGRAYLVLVEHVPPVITLGRSADSAHVLASPQRLRQEGIEVHKSTRGGDVTYHGPGQLVGYPIMRLGPRRRVVHQYVHDLEEALIRLLGRLGVQAGRVGGDTGVWTDDGKIAAIGIAIHRWVAWHGFALNVSVDFSHFDLIVPCGLHGKRVTDLSRLTGRADVDPLKGPLVECFAQVMAFDDVRPSQL